MIPDSEYVQYWLKLLWRERTMETIKKLALDMAAVCIVIASLLTIGIVFWAWLVGM